METAERTRLKAELAKFGIQGEYLNGWQPREDLYLHTPRLNISGIEVRPAGAVVANQPSVYDHKLRQAILGALPFRPSPSCQCKGCRERDWDNVIISEEGHISAKGERLSPFSEFEEQAPDLPTINMSCPDCDFVVRPDSKKPKNSLRFHRSAKHKASMAE